MNDELNFKRISIEQAKALIDDGATLADIRDPDSYNTAHIINSQHVTNVSIENFVRENDLDKPLVVFCYHGNSSQSAAAYLFERGFEDVYSVDGGFDHWQQAYPNTITSGE